MAPEIKMSRDEPCPDTWAEEPVGRGGAGQGLVPLRPDGLCRLPWLGGLLHREVWAWPSAGHRQGGDVEGFLRLLNHPVSSLGLQNHHERFWDSAFTDQEAWHGVRGGALMQWGCGWWHGPGFSFLHHYLVYVFIALLCKGSVTNGFGEGWVR